MTNLTNLTNEAELLARDMAATVREAMAVEVGKLRAEIVAVKAEAAELRGQLKVLKEITLGRPEQKQMPELIFPGESHARTRALS